VFGDELGGDFLAVEGVAGNDLRAIPLGGGALVRRRVGRHDDNGAHTEQARCQGQPLGVVAAGVGDDAGRSLALGELADGVVGAAKLERAHALEVFTLKEYSHARGGRVGGHGARSFCVAPGGCVDADSQPLVKCA